MEGGKISKSIKVSEDVYQLLLEMQRPRETFSELINRLMTAAALLMKVEPLIRSQLNFLEDKLRKADAEKALEG